MDTPGSDIFSVTGMVAGGAQIIVFTTGRGTPVGFPIAPVIKIASNSELFEMMNEDMDMNAGRILEGLSIEEAGAGLIDVLKNVANGEMTKAEVNRQDVLSIHTVGPAF
jgi:altronate dehydratase large subunit